MTFLFDKTDCRVVSVLLDKKSFLWNLFLFQDFAQLKAAVKGIYIFHAKDNC